MYSNVCFKTYVQGSYFGDIDALNSMTRLFTVRAEEPLKLAVLDRDQLEHVLSSDTSINYIIMKRSLKRYIRYHISMKRISNYNKISMNNDYWMKDCMKDNVDINSKITTWLSFLSDVYKRKDNDNDNIMMNNYKINSRIKMKSRKSKISILDNTPTNAHTNRYDLRHTISHIYRMYSNIYNLSYTIDVLSNDIITIQNNIGVSKDNKPHIDEIDIPKDNSQHIDDRYKHAATNNKCEYCSNLMGQLKLLLTESRTYASMNKNDIINRLNDIVYSTDREFDSSSISGVSRGITSSQSVNNEGNDNRAMSRRKSFKITTRKVSGDSDEGDNKDEDVEYDINGFKAISELQDSLKASQNMNMKDSSIDISFSNNIEHNSNINIPVFNTSVRNSNVVNRDSNMNNRIIKISNRLYNIKSKPNIEKKDINSKILK